METEEIFVCKGTEIVFDRKVILSDVVVEVNAKNVCICKGILNVLVVCNAFLGTISVYDHEEISTWIEVFLQDLY